MTAHRIKPTQLQFVENYLKTGNASLSYSMMYPQCKTPHANAAQLMKNKSVQNLINNNRQKMELQISVTFEWKVERLKSIIDKCLEDRDLLDHEGNVIGSTYRPEAATRAIAELNKMQGHYAPEKHVVVNVNQSIEKVRETLIEYDKY